MTYQTTVTTKGQITVPKTIREILKIKPHSRVIIEIQKNKKEATLKPATDILELASRLKPKRKISALRTRKEFEKRYERI